jgi:hemerythrin-like domain-containing protein
MGSEQGTVRACEHDNKRYIFRTVHRAIFMCENEYNKPSRSITCREFIQFVQFLRNYRLSKMDYAPWSHLV